MTEALIERECNIQVRKWRESRGELMHQPGRRLHGTRAIFEYKRRAASISSGGSFSFLGSSIPPPGPLRASSSLLSLPGFRKSKAPFHSYAKKGSFSGPSGFEGFPPPSPPAVTSSSNRGPSQKPPMPPGAGHKGAPQSPLVSKVASSSHGPAPTSESTSAQGEPTSSAPMQSTQQPPATLAPSPKIVSEQITPTIPSPTANNTPLPPLPDSKKETASPSADAANVEEEGKKKKKSKEDKKKEKEDEKKKQKEKKEKEKAEKERLKKEKEKLEKEKKKGGKKKDKGGGGGDAEDKSGAAAAKEST